MYTEVVIMVYLRIANSSCILFPLLSVTTKKIFVESRVSVMVPFRLGSVELKTRIECWQGWIRNSNEKEPWQDQSIVAVIEECDFGSLTMA